jgi:predicted site-specific integrase-resolvase
MSGWTVVYLRVSSDEQRPDLEAQVGRVMTWCARQALRVDEVGSGMNGRRLLRDPEVGTMVVEHPDG